MQTKIVTLVVLALVCFTSAIRVVDQNKGKTLACCGPSNTYDTTTQICCINTVFPIPAPGGNLLSVCCGNKLLPTTQKCCNAVAGVASIEDRAIDVTATCCGTNALTNSATQVCCAGTVVTITNGLTQCCGNRVFNPATDICCANTVIAGGVGKTCCGNAAFTPGTQDCCGGKVQSIANGLQCCGSSTFNPTTQTCCGGSASTGVSLSCCGTRAFNSANQICCDIATSAVFSSSNGEQCCGPSKTFNPATQTCCSIDVDNFVKTGKDSNGCDIFTNQPKTNYNVGNVANGQCCAGIAFDSTKSQCCIDRVVNNPNNRQCCGRNLYDPANDVCCPDTLNPDAKVIANRAADGLQCCGTATFDPTTSSCPCGVVVSLNNDLINTNTNPNVAPACCGATQFDGNDKLCCSSANGNYLFNLDPAAGLKCCPQDGKTVYNSGYQICCDKKSQCPGKPSTSIPSFKAPSPSSNSPSQNRDLLYCGDACCDGKGYFTKFQKCCDKEIVDFNNDAASALTNPLACCGKEIYNPIYEACCSETINGKTSYAVFGGPGNWQLCCKN